jgi:hypothetical protein
MIEWVIVMTVVGGPHEREFMILNLTVVCYFSMTLKINVVLVAFNLIFFNKVNGMRLIISLLVFCMHSIKRRHYIWKACLLCDCNKTKLHEVKQVQHWLTGKTGKSRYLKWYNFLIQHLWLLSYFGSLIIKKNPKYQPLNVYGFVEIWMFIVSKNSTMLICSTANFRLNL